MQECPECLPWLLPATINGKLTVQLPQVDGFALSLGTPLDGSGDIKALSVFSIDQQFTDLIISEHV